MRKKGVCVGGAKKMAKLRIESMITRKKVLPLVMTLGNSIIKKLKLVEKINETVKWDKAHWKVSPGELAKVLVLTTLLRMRVPLTHLEDLLEEIDTSFFMEEEGREAGAVNSFNVGRALERIGESNYDSLYENIAMEAMREYKIPSKQLHADTTTISFYGEYDISTIDLTEEEENELLQIERGYNKDGRPESKQMVVGQIVNEHGIPLVSRTMNGATSDVSWNKEAIQYFKKIQKAGFSESIYIADSKLVTEELIRSMNEPNQFMRFVSRCPANFCEKLEARTIKKAYATGQWEDLGQFHEGKRASIYKGVSFIETIYNNPMRLLVLESSSLAQKAETALLKKREELTPCIRELEKKKFACLTDAKEEIEKCKGLSRQKLFECIYNIEERVKDIWPKGRRKKDAQPIRQETSYHIQVIQVLRNEEACVDYIQRESCIVIISNVTENLSDRDLFKAYKGQHVVENSFRVLKSPCLASVIYLKNQDRIKALSMLLTLSLLVRAIIQFKLREGLKTFNLENPEQKLHVGWGNRPLKNPTYMLFFEHSLHCRFEKAESNTYTFAWPSAETRTRVSTLLLLMDISLENLLQ